MIIDTHCHLGIDDYENRDEVIKNMGNNIMIVSGVSNQTNIEALELASKYNNIFVTIGIHPEYCDSYNETDIKYIEENILNPQVVGIGEIGLDYHYTKDNIDKQKELFIKLIRLAKKYNKAIVVHSRDAIEDTYNILKEEYSPNLKVIMHCYSSTYEMALKLTELGVMLGIGGVITFTNAKKLVEVVNKIDIKYLLLETDSPYLAPTPFRGTINEPKNVLLVAEKISEIKGVSVDEVINITTANAFRQFDLNLKM